MTATRPKIAPKHTPGSEKNREASLDQGLRVTIDGEVHEVRDGDMTPQIARELRALSGMSYVRLVQTIKADPDIDVLSTFVWLARRILGEVVEFDEVAVSYEAILADGFDMSPTSAEELDTSNPEG